MRFDRGVVHILLWLVIFFTINVWGLTGEWFIYIVVACYIVNHYCLRFDRGVVHIIVADYNVDHYCFMFDRRVFHIGVAGYNVDQHCLRFDRGVLILLWLAILLPNTVWGLTGEWFIHCCDWWYFCPLMFEVWQGSGSYIVMIGDIFYH